MGRRVDINGQRFGRLIVLARAENRGRFAAWLCWCDCGEFKTVVGSSLRTGNTRSCGCLQRIHGMTNTPLYLVWRSMRSRCENPRTERWPRYGGRGISVCAEWRHDPKAFIDWALSHGYERGLQIDRMDNDAGYSPSNCRFVTAAENSRNRPSRVAG
jgi:hypothetical protein